MPDVFGSVFMPLSCWEFRARFFSEVAKERNEVGAWDLLLAAVSGMRRCATSRRPRRTAALEETFLNIGVFAYTIE